MKKYQKLSRSILFLFLFLFNQIKKLFRFKRIFENNVHIPLTRIRKQVRRIDLNKIINKHLHTLTP